MVRTAWTYLAEQVRPRWREIVTEPEWWLAVAVALVGALWGHRLALGDSKIGDVLTAVLAYAAVAFGFCLAGLTVALTLPDQRFAVSLAKLEAQTPLKGFARWRRTKGEAFTESAYGKLLFVFSWTAALHWVVIVLAFVLLAARGYDAALIPDDASWWTRGITSMLALFLIYAGMQFLVTLITLSQVGNAYIDDLRSRD
jgi:hypothetical protein